MTVEAGPGTAHLHLAGDLDYDTSDELTQQADRCLNNHPDLEEMRLICTALRFCDSMGISALLMIHRKTTERGVRLYLDNPPPFLGRILNTTGIQRLFSPAHRSNGTSKCPPAIASCDSQGRRDDVGSELLTPGERDAHDADRNGYLDRRDQDARKRPLRR
ncbi:STAS domain-containing protein [Streptomyces sp. LN549]|uniref:STAS domain-containing protein n=1 Tax=Streptomyces sp. LN549 TaxID=3112979 RepID=UPI00371F172E